MEELWAEGDGLCAARMVNNSNQLVIHSLFWFIQQILEWYTYCVSGTRNRNDRHMMSYLQDLVVLWRDVFT